MGVKFTKAINKFPDMEAKLKIINGKNISVGVQGEHAWLAGIHEFGCDITPKNARYLTVPCSPASFGHRASDFSDLFFFQAKSGSKWLARNKGKDEIELLFALMEHVKIPERAFLRNGFEEVHMKVIEKAERILPQVIEGTISELELYNLIGTLLRDGVKNYARDLSSPPKSPLTLAANGGKANPLVQTGDMINSIEFEVD